MAFPLSLPSASPAGVLPEAVGSMLEPGGKDQKKGGVTRSLGISGPLTPTLQCIANQCFTKTEQEVGRAQMSTRIQAQLRAILKHTDPEQPEDPLQALVHRFSG